MSDPEDPTTGEPVTYIVVEPRTTKRGRRALAWVCIVLVWILFIPTVITTWGDRTFLDTGNFIEATKSVISRDDVQQAIVVRVTDEIMALDTVQDAIADWMPEELQNFQDLVVNAVRTGIQRLLTFLIQTNVAQSLLDTATDRTLRRLHTQLVNGEDLTVSLTDLIGLFDFDPQSLVGRATQRVPDDFAQVTLLTRDQVPEIYSGINIAEQAWIWLSIATLLLAIAAVAVAAERRRALYLLAFGIAGVAVLLNVVVRVGAGIEYAALETNVQVVARQTGDVFLASLYRSLWRWTLIGVVVGVIALAWPRLVRATAAASNRARDLAGRARTEAPELADKAGSGVERAWASTKGFVEGLGLGARADALTAQVQANPIAFRWGIVVVCALGFLIWPGHSFNSLLFFAVLGVAAVAATEFLRGRGTPPEVPVAPAAPMAATAPAAGPTAAPAGTAPGAPAPLDDDTRFAVLERLGELHDKKILTAAEFAAEKARLLGS